MKEHDLAVCNFQETAIVSQEQTFVQLLRIDSTNVQATPTSSHGLKHEAQGSSLKAFYDYILVLRSRLPALNEKKKSEEAGTSSENVTLDSTPTSCITSNRSNCQTDSFYTQ